MSKFQKRCVFVGAFLFILLACFPPWYTLKIPSGAGLMALGMSPGQRVRWLRRHIRRLGHHFIFLPPQSRAHVDLRRLFVLWAAVAVGTGAVAVAWPRAKAQVLGQLREPGAHE